MKMCQLIFESSVWISEHRNCTFFAESNGCIMLNMISRVFHFHHRYKKLQSYYCLLNTTRESYAQYDKKMLERQFIFLKLLWYTHISTEFWKYAPTKKSKQLIPYKCLMCFSICSGIYYIIIAMKSSLLEHSICRKLNN